MRVRSLFLLLPRRYLFCQVMDIVNKLIETVGGPVLVVARKHLAQEMNELPGSRDFNIFNTHQPVRHFTILLLS